MKYTKGNPLRVCTTFSGYDSQCLALDRLKQMNPEFDYELVAWSEIDKYAIMAHNAIYPQWADRNFGDISKIDWSQVPDFDLLTYSSPCLTEDTLILTHEGYKQMKDIKVGDLVRSDKGVWRRVTKKFDNGVKPTVYLNALGFENIHCTTNHRFLIRSMSRVWKNSERKYVRVFSTPEYKEVKDLKEGDYFGIPVDTRSALPEWCGVEDNRWGHHNVSNRISTIMESNEFWYLMGRYVGDGWKKESNTGRGIVISCGGRHREKLESAITHLGYSFTKVSERTADKYQISSNELFCFVDRFGYYAYGKKIDGDTMGLPTFFLESFLNGIEESDGCYTQGNYKVSTTSRELAYGIAYCVNKVFHTHCRVYYIKKEPTCVIEGRTCNQHDHWQVVYSHDPKKQNHAFYEDGYIWFPFKSITPAEDEQVYDIEVETDHSFICQGCISHNCQDFSNAGLQRGGEKGSGTRSSLLWYVEEAIKEKHPKFLLMENVAALVGSKFINTFNAWRALLDSYGYTSYAQVLNSKDYGVPQNRDRIFLVSILNSDETYYFPKPFPLEKCLKDVLEENVDECYYLSEKAIEGFIAHNENHEKKETGFI